MSAGTCQRRCRWRGRWAKRRTFCDVFDVSLVTKAPVRLMSAWVLFQCCRRVLNEGGGSGQCFLTAARAGCAIAVKQPGTKQDTIGMGVQDQGPDRRDGKTHWVNFHVGACCGSPSTMISACTGADAGTSPGIGYVAKARQVLLGIPGEKEGLLLAAV